MLYLRMLLYFIFAALASQGIAIFDAATGTLTVKVDDLMLVLPGIAAYVVTFAASRIAKARGGAT